MPGDADSPAILHLEVTQRRDFSATMATHGVNIVAGLVSLRLSECEHSQHFLLAQMWKPCRVAASRALTVPFLPAILSPALRCRVLGMRFWIVEFYVTVCCLTLASVVFVVRWA